MNKTRQRKIMERSIIFTITCIGVLFFTIFDFGFVYVYKIDGYNDLQWFAFWTHLSNLAAFTWITLALIAVTTNNNELEHWIQHWNIKNTIYTFIITTGAVFILVAYFPVVIHYSKPGNVGELVGFVGDVAVSGNLQFASSVDEVNALIEGGQTIFLMTNGSEINIDPSTAYRASVIIGTTFKHVIIPGMFVYLAFTELGYYRTKSLNDFNRTMIQFIWPSLYLVYATTLAASGLISPPYPVLDFGFTHTFYDMTLFNQCIWVLAALVMDLSVGFIYIFISMFQNHWNKAMCEKHNINQEDALQKSFDANEALIKATKEEKTISDKK